MRTISNYTLYTLYALISAAFLFGASLKAEAKVVVNARIDSTQMLMGDRTAMQVEIVTDGEKGQAVDMPPTYIDPKMGFAPYCGMEVYKVEADSSDLGNGRQSYMYNFGIQAFDPGMIIIPGPGYVIGDDTIRAKDLSINILAVDVSVAGNPDSIKMINPMYGPVAIKAKWYDWIPDWWYWILIVIAAIALAIFGVIYYRALKKGEPMFTAPKKVVPPYDLAVQRLEELREQHLPERGQEKEYYTRLTDILRQYLEGRFGINAMEMTSSEIRRRVNASPETRLPARHLDELLRIADFVKFAKVRPLPDDNVKSYNSAVQFVKDTRPTPEQVAEGKDQVPSDKNAGNTLGNVQGGANMADKAKDQNKPKTV